MFIFYDSTFCKNSYKRTRYFFFSDINVKPFTTFDEKKYRQFVKIANQYVLLVKKSLKTHHQKKFQSNWRLLTYLDLKGHGNHKSYDCVRFGHFELTNGIFSHETKQVLTTYEKTFKNPNKRFPWEPAYSEDVRANKVVYTTPCIIKLQDNTTLYFNKPKKKKQLTPVS